MPFVQFPTADDDIGGSERVEGGLIVPLTISLPSDWSLATMLEIDATYNNSRDRYGAAAIHTASLSHSLVQDLDGFVEYVGIASEGLDAGYQASVGMGATWLVKPDVQLDAAIYFGLSEQADDVSALVGLSLRI
jgi:hypothetical protein